LPSKSRWLAFPNVPSAKVAEVDFLIDGRIRCVEHYAPYNYGNDDFHGHLGSLVTSWFSPGKHRFSARAVLTNGQKATDTVVARVLPAPEPPAERACRLSRGQDDRGRGPVWMVPYVNGHANLSRYGRKDIGAGWREDGPARELPLVRHRR
jgi:hypothetical protein